MSFNPISIILHENSSDAKSTYKKSIETIKDIYHSNVESISNAIIAAHQEFTNFQKNLFSKIQKNDFNIDKFTSDILSKKFDKASNGIFDILNDKITDNSQALLKYIKNTKDQITILKKYYGDPSNLRNAHALYTSKGIGFRTINLPSNEQFIESIRPYSLAFRDMTILKNDSLFKKFDKCYLSSGALAEEMYDKIKYVFTPDKSYPAKSYIENYDITHKDMIAMLSEQKNRYKEIRDLLNDIHDDRTGAYDRFMVEINKKKTLEEDEKQKQKMIVINNYKILSDSLIKMADLITVYHRIQLKILLMSYENYREIIQNIYDDTIGDDK